MHPALASCSNACLRKLWRSVQCVYVNSTFAAEKPAAAGALSVTGYEGPRKTILAVDDDLNPLALGGRFPSGYGFAVLAVSGVDNRTSAAVLADRKLNAACR